MEENVEKVESGALGFSMVLRASFSKVTLAFSLSTTTPSTNTPFISTAYPLITAPESYDLKRRKWKDRGEDVKVEQKEILGMEREGGKEERGRRRFAK